MKLSEKQFRNYVYLLFEVVIALTKDLITFSAAKVTGALTVVGESTVGGFAGGVTSHDYGAAAADWTLSATEEAAVFVTATNASGAVNAIATPTEGKMFVVTNSSGFALTVKASGQSGASVANGAVALLRGNGTDFVTVGTFA